MDEELRARRKEVKALLKDNLKDTLEFELWPWVQVVSTIIYLVVIFLGDPWTGHLWGAYLATFVWIGIQLLAVYRAYQKEGRK